MRTTTANHLPERHCMHRTLSLLTFLFMNTVVAMDHEKQAYFELVPYEITSLIIRKVPTPNATLPQAARSVLDVALLDKEFLALAQPIIHKYRDQQGVVEDFIKKHVSLPNVLFALPKEERLSRDSHALRTIEKKLSENSIELLPGMFSVLKTATSFTYDELKKCIKDCQSEADILLEKRFFLLDINYYKKSQNYNNEIIADITFLIENGANPNLNSKIHEMPLLHKACIVGNPNLVRVLLSNGADVNKKSEQMDETAIESMLYASTSQTTQEKLEIMEELIAHGVPLLQSSRENYTILDVALSLKHNTEPEIVTFLRSKGAKTYQELREEHLN